MCNFTSESLGPVLWNLPRVSWPSGYAKSLHIPPGNFEMWLVAAVFFAGPKVGQESAWICHRPQGLAEISQIWNRHRLRLRHSAIHPGHGAFWPWGQSVAERINWNAHNSEDVVRRMQAFLPRTEQHIYMAPTFWYEQILRDMVWW